MKLKILLLIIWVGVFVNYFNVFSMQQSFGISNAEKIYIACFRGGMDKTDANLHELVSCGIDMDSEECIKDELIGFTALHMASYYGLYYAIPKLISAGANIDKTVGLNNKENSGMTALQLAIRRGILPSVCELLSCYKRLGIKLPQSCILTSQCFKRFCEHCYGIYLEHQSPESLEITQREIIVMAEVLVNAGFKFDEDTKIYVASTLFIKL